MTRVVRLIRTVGLVFAFALVPVGMFNLLFSAAGIVTLPGIDGPVTAWIVLIALGIAHMVPALLLAWRPVRSARKGQGFAMVICGPLIGWTGFDALILRGDWGDAVLWLPYLVTGLCLLALGTIFLAHRPV